MASFKIIIILMIGISFEITAFAKDETKALYGEVFATKKLFSKKNDLEKTYASLIRLSVLYKGRRDAESLRHGAEVEALIETRKVSLEKCSFSDIYYQKIIHSKATLNIIPYLDDNIERLFNFCKDTLYAQLDQGLSNLNAQEMDHIEKIRQYIIHGRYKVREPLYHISPETIEDGLVDYLKELTKGTTADRTVNFGTAVRDLCGKIVYELFQPLSSLGLIYDGGRRPLLNEKVISWLINMEICKQVTQRPELIDYVEARLRT